MGLEARKSERNPRSTWDKITDIEEARGRIHELFERGERPLVSIPEEYVDALVNGLRAHSTWIPGFDAVAGTFAREPYMPGDGKRVVVRVDLEESQIEPRFTGPDKSFEGVVVLRGPIPAEHLHRIAA